MQLEMLPAGCGDCLILEYVHDGRLRCVLIDGGTPNSYPELRNRLKARGQTHFDLIVVTHVDADHIGGLIPLLRDRVVTYDDLWFNGYAHMKRYLADALGGDSASVAGLGDEAGDLLGPAQGEALSALVRGGRWNQAFDGGPIVVPEQGPLPRVELPGGLVLTVLSPTPATLRRMALVWRKSVRELEDELSQEAGHSHAALPDRLGGGIDVLALADEPENRDDAPANGSSIALLAELGSRSCLLAADAWPDVLATSLRRLAAERGLRRLHVGAVKLPHHGSKRNVTRELLQLLDTQDFLVSTNGTRHRHPDAQAIARIINGRQGVRLHFNAASSVTTPWQAPSLQGRFKFTAMYPDADGSLRVTLS